MKIRSKDCRSCIWYKATSACGRAMCAYRNTTIHQIFYSHVEVECFDYEYYKEPCDTLPS